MATMMGVVTAVLLAITGQVAEAKRMNVVGEVVAPEDEKQAEDAAEASCARAKL